MISPTLKLRFCFKNCRFIFVVFRYVIVIYSILLTLLVFRCYNVKRGQGDPINPSSMYGYLNNTDITWVNNSIFQERPNYLASLESPLKSYSVNLSYVFKQRKRGVRTKYCTTNTDRMLCMSDNAGRLGNIIFQFASLYGLSKHTGVVPQLDLKVYEKLSHVFVMNQTFVKFVDLSRPTFIKGITELEYPRYSFDAQNLNVITGKSWCHLRLSGYYNSWLYAHEYLDQLSTVFTFTDKNINLARKALVKLTQRLRTFTALRNSSEIVYVGVHVRHGDIKSIEYYEHGFLTPSMVYYQTAIAYYQMRYDHVAFVVTSDDKPWCVSKFEVLAERLHAAIVVSDEDDPKVDMALLVQCNHTIMSVGTFGIWTSILTGGDVIYYGFPFKPASNLADVHNDHNADFYLPYWVPLPNRQHTS